MTEPVLKAPLDEQKICVACGMCCDGTLFLHAHLDNGERGNLPEKIESSSYNKYGNDYFRLPCRYFSGKCIIYDQKKANVCSGYRCQLLKDFASEKITLGDALSIVFDALTMRDQILEQYSIFSGSRRKIYFKKLLRKIGKMQESASVGNLVVWKYDQLLAKCNIFEALLIKYFSTSGEFEKLIMR